MNKIIKNTLFIALLLLMSILMFTACNKNASVIKDSETNPTEINTSIETTFEQITLEETFSTEIITEMSTPEVTPPKETPQASNPFIIEGDTLKGLTNYGKTLTEIVIPSEWDGKKIVSIESGAFERCLKLESVIISDSIQSIGSRAFVYCSNLKSVIIGEGVTNIGNYAFKDCKALTSIQFNAKNCADIKYYETRVFELAGRNGDGITVTIGKNVERIPANLFRPYMKEDWANIKTVTFEENSQCRSIGSYAFYRCQNLSTVTLGDSITVIEEWAFSDCGITQLKITDSVVSIKKHAFALCDNLQHLEIGESLSLIEPYAFSCNNLTSVVFKNTDRWVYTESETSTHCTMIPNLQYPEVAATYLSSTYRWCYWLL